MKDSAQIDSIVLSVIGGRRTKVAMVIVRVADAMGCDSPAEDGVYEVISRHIEALVHDGHLVAQGDVKNRRFSEVRLAPN